MNNTPRKTYQICFIPAATPVAVQASDWNGFQKQAFALEERPCFVVLPEIAAPGKPWVWRTSFPDYHPEVDIELLHNGVHVGYIDCVDMLGADSALDLMDKFYALVRWQWGLADKPAMEAVSRGGLHAYRYAAVRRGSIGKRLQHVTDALVDFVCRISHHFVRGLEDFRFVGADTAAAHFVPVADDIVLRREDPADVPFPE